MAKVLMRRLINSAKAYHQSKQAYSQENKPPNNSSLKSMLGYGKCKTGEKS
ncbi:hypothetical protein APA_4066 [Pseudanabaena sp. lw0831]|uniref:hypothetical protein n=1 Tax=Pseudanabaena sp. lw0831 TaxID=1357935 RepID=UPI0019152D6C|nr:hypothetical protein [Pseudanabaena sp. lw0831]GBO51962.1 hypothetical protein APA_4066 [Pseudanabaena sp. lw0831]